MIKRAIDAELFIVRVSSRVLKRNFTKYFSVVFKSYLMGLLKPTQLYIKTQTSKDITLNLIKPRPSQWIKMSYFWWREIDDIVDGDIQIPEWYNNIDEYFTQIQYDILNTSEKPKTQLWKSAAHILSSYQKYTGRNIYPYLVDFLEGMKTEYYRRINQSILSEQELNTLYDQSFRGSHEIYLAALWSQNNSQDLKELPQILWWMYGLKDMQQDLKGWIINIPKEVVEKLDLHISTYINSDKIKELLNLDIIKERMDIVVEKQYQNLTILKKKYTELDSAAQKICNWLLPEIESFIKQHRLSY